MSRVSSACCALANDIGLRALALIVLVLGVGRAAASPDSPWIGPPFIGERQYLFGDRHPDKGVLCYGMSFSYPQAIGCYVTLIGASRYCASLQPGLGGMKAQIGYASPYFDTGHSEYAVSMLRTWDDPLGIETDQTYLGLEYTRSSGIVGYHLGAYCHVAGDDDDYDFLVSAGILLGWDY